MPSGRYFDFSLKCGEDHLIEYAKEKQYYVESDLNIPGISYYLPTSELVCGETETQSWPVTPYKILLSPLHPRSVTCWYEVYCDGAYVWNKPLSGGRVFTIDGFTKDGINRELLFSLPRFARNPTDQVESERLSDIGSITIKCIEAKYEGQRMQQFTRMKDFSNKESIKGAGDGFEQATKKDCSRVEGGNQGLTTTKSGRENFRFSESSQPTYRPIQRFRRGQLLETLTINYRMKQCLIDMGLIEGQEGVIVPAIQPKLTSSVKVKTLCSPAVSPEDTKKAMKIKREKDVIDETLSKMKELNLTTMSVVDSKKHIKEEMIARVNEHGKEEKFIIRHNNMVIPEKRIIHIDDDIMIIEDLDDSVVYIGDDDCCIIDGPTEVIPYLELHDDSIVE